MSTEVLKHLEELEKRVTKLEKHGFEDTLTLVEILSSITFFGGLKMEKCKYAEKEQCRLFLLGSDAKKKIPLATDCTIDNCRSEPGHCHLELSNIVCALCPEAKIPESTHQK